MNTDITTLKTQIRHLATILKNTGSRRKFILRNKIEKKRKELRLAIKFRIFSGIDA